MTQLVYGVGINDANYQVAHVVDGKQVLCPIYTKWRGMIDRVYNSKEKRPTYIDCSVSKVWHKFMNFREWYNDQPQSDHLDKDLKFPYNKVYSPETCNMIPVQVNKFISIKHGNNGLAAGVSIKLGTQRYVAQISNPFTNKQQHIGYFDDEKEAELAYLTRKHQYALEMAETITNPIVSDLLRSHFIKRMELI